VIGVSTYRERGERRGRDGRREKKRKRESFEGTPPVT
jgi:hypothetical protein